MTRRTVLLLIGLFCCWSAEALAQTVDTSAIDTLTEQTSSATQQVTTATEPVTDQVSSTAGSVTPPATNSGQTGDSGGGTSSAEECECDTNSAGQCETRSTSGGSEQVGGAGGRASGGGAASGGGTRASRADLRDRVLAARREPARGEGVLGTTTEGGTPLPAAPLPNPPNEFPFWGGIAVLLVLGLGFAGFVAALTNHLLARTRSG